MSKIKNFVSVIIPTFNEEKYIKQTLLALKRQDFSKKFEIIVVDSESKDKTVSIAKRFADKVIRTKKEGVGKARNFGAKFAKGDILIFIDGDTVPMPNLISQFVNSFKQKSVVCVACPLAPSEFNLKNSLLYAIYNSNAILSLKINKPHIAGSCVAYRRDVFFKAGGFDEETHLFEDFALSEKMPEFGKTIFNEETFAVTSTRRIKKWGVTNAVKNYLQFYLQYLTGNKKFERSKYEVIR